MRKVLFHSSLFFCVAFAALTPIALIHADDAKAKKGGIGATPASAFSLPEGFAVELLYEVPSDKQGSWVAMTTDPKGRLLASDQYGSLYRITVKDAGGVDVERLKGDFGMAHGMLSAFGSLYINVNGQSGNKNQKEVKSGIYRLTDTTGDDQYDKVEHLLELHGRGEHGPHALVLSPDGKQIYISSGNTTDLPAEVPLSRVPRHWSEDHLLGSMPDARGHNAGRLAPGGWVARMNPDGGDFEIIATGFRNQYDIAFDTSGELFTYDADMEWDVGTAWYRPTRVNHVVSGAEFGWRNGAGKWPAYYPDSLGSVVDIGPGSPTGIVFGTGAKFPAKYQKARSTSVTGATEISSRFTWTRPVRLTPARSRPSPRLRRCRLPILSSVLKMECCTSRLEVAERNPPSIESATSETNRPHRYRWNLTRPRLICGSSVMNSNRFMKRGNLPPYPWRCQISDTKTETFASRLGLRWNINRFSNGVTRCLS
ncbi:MAG: hypothetical protein R3C05_25615 [Pirellulaceae bacterium]